MGSDDVAEWTARTNLETDSWLLEQDGRIVAAGAGQAHAGSYFARGCVRPSAKGIGLGLVLVELAEAGAARHGAPRILQVTLGPDDAARRLLESHGYREARRHFAMTIELDEPPPAPELPDGLAFEQFHAADAVAWYSAMNEIFEDEWSFDLGTFDDWWRQRSGDDHTLWSLVRDGDEIAGLVQAEHGRRGGGLVQWVDVRKPWRRQGVGRALLLRAFDALHARGASRIGLGVDAENPSQATRLYESVGMHVEADHATLVKEL